MENLFSTLGLIFLAIIIAKIILVPIKILKKKTTKKENATQIIIKPDKKIELIKKAEALQMNLNDYILYVFNKEMPN